MAPLVLLAEGGDGLNIKSYCQDVILRAKKEINKKTKRKFVIIGAIAVVLLLTGATLELDEDLIRNMEDYVDADYFKTQMDLMKDGTDANEIITGIRSYSSVDYEFEIPMREENKAFVEDVTTRLKEGVLEFSKG